MKKIALFMAVCLLAFTEYAKAETNIPRVTTFVAESTSHVYFKEFNSQYLAFLTGDFLFQLSDEQFRNMFIAAFDPGDPNHQRAQLAFTDGALDKYVDHLTYLFGNGRMLTDNDVIAIMEATTFTPAPSNLSTAYEVGRLTSNPNDKVAWFTRSPYKEEMIGVYNGTGWVLTDCGNITRPVGGGTPRTSTRRPPTPRTEDDDVYTQTTNRNVNINRNEGGGGYNRDQHILVEVQNTPRSNEMTDYEREDIRLKKKMGTQGWVNIGLGAANTWFNGVNTYRGIRFEEQRTQYRSTSRVTRDYGYNRGRTYDRGYRYEDEDFQGPSPSGRYAGRSTRYDRYDDEYYDDYDQGGGNTNTWGAVATRALRGDQHYEEDLRMYSRDNYMPRDYRNGASYASNNRSGHVLSTYGPRGRNVLRR